MANEGTIRIHRSIGGVGAAFRVSFVPYDSDGEGVAGVRSFHEVQQVRTFLKSLGVNAEVIRDVQRQLAVPVLLQYWQIALRWKWVILGIIVSALALGFIVTLLRTPKYTATARIEISRDG